MMSYDIYYTLVIIIFLITVILNPMLHREIAIIYITVVRVADIG